MVDVINFNLRLINFVSFFRYCITKTVYVSDTYWCMTVHPVLIGVHYNNYIYEEKSKSHPNV